MSPSLNTEVIDGGAEHAAVVLLVTLLPAHARAEVRIALLIGNESYAREIGQLANPHNDVAVLEQALKGLGFEAVTVRDAGLGALTAARVTYSRSASESSR